MSAFIQPVDAAHRLLDDVKHVIVEASANAPRTQQVAVGPSEAGDACARKLGYKIAGTPPVNTGCDPLPSAVGTGAHAWLADAFHANNNALGRARWLIETPVNCGPITGSSDLYDHDTHTVIDHKFPGQTAMRGYKNDGPSATYVTQGHLYGLGHVNAGRRVDRVAIVFYPRGGMLSGAHVWSEPFNPAIAADAITRLTGITGAVDRHGVDAATHLPATPSRLCDWCPWHDAHSTNVAAACAGAMHEETNPTQRNESR